MNDRENHTTPDRETIFQAIRDSWSAETCTDPAVWSPDNPSRQQCDASAFVAWEHLGGELVLGQVFLDGEQTEHHYWNRIDGHDVDLTRDQFVGGEEIRELEVLTSSFLQENAATMRSELLERIALLRERVDGRLEAFENA